jgi:hypothetical protein
MEVVGSSEIVVFIHKAALCLHTRCISYTAVPPVYWIKIVKFPKEQITVVRAGTIQSTPKFSIMVIPAFLISVIMVVSSRWPF